MIWFLLALLAVSALAPLIGADTRDGRDWRPTKDRGFRERQEGLESRARVRVRTNGSPARSSAARGPAASHRPTSAAC